MFRGSQYVALGILLCCFLGWILVHAYVTIMYMTPEEQGRAASYERYVAVAIAPFLLAGLMAALESGMRCRPFLTRRLLKGGTCLLGAGMLLFFFMRPRRFAGRYGRDGAGGPDPGPGVGAGIPILARRGTREVSVRERLPVLPHAGQAGGFRGKCHRVQSP